MLMFHSVAWSPSMVVFPPAVFSTRSRRDSAMANAGNIPKKRPLWSRNLLATFRTAVRDTDEKEPVCHHDDRSRLEHISDNLLGAIAAFGGPHSIAQLAATNRNLHWRCSQDGIWQNLCSEYGKMVPGDDEQSSVFDPAKSWKDVYLSTPMVPVDAPTLGHAVALQCKRASNHVSTTNSTILVRPGCYQEPGTVEIPRHMNLTIQCLPADDRRRQVAAVTLAPQPQNTNQPLFRVQPGASLTLRNLEIKHAASGHDYWHGNGAIFCGHGHNKRGGSQAIVLSKNQVLGPIEEFDLSDPMTYLLLCNSIVTSVSGRGIVAIGEGVTVLLQRSRVEHCAATGIFMERAALSITDGSFVGLNGQGSQEIAAGQSNVFIDRGIFHVTDDCCIIKGSVKALDAQLLGHAEQIAKTLYPVSVAY